MAGALLGHARRPMEAAHSLFSGTLMTNLSGVLCDFVCWLQWHSVSKGFKSFGLTTITWIGLLYVEEIMRFSDPGARWNGKRGFWHCHKPLDVWVEQHRQVSTSLSLLSTLSASPLGWHSHASCCRRAIWNKSASAGEALLFRECPLTPAGGHFSQPYWEHPLGGMVSDILALGTRGCNWNNRDE